MVIEKRHVSAFITNSWRTVLQQHFPELEVMELILVHQITYLICFPLLWLAFFSKLHKEAADSTFLHLGPCRKFMRDIKIHNPYVPNIYLINPKGEAIWMSSSGPTEEDLRQLKLLLKDRTYIKETTKGFAGLETKIQESKNDVFTKE